MKTIGLIGGMSWESTELYYRIINETIRKELGGLHSAKIILYSVDFDEIEKYQSEGNWNKSGEILRDIAIKLEEFGADMIVICTNTMHKVVPLIEKAVNIPIIHIADATAEELIKDGTDKVLLLGTKYTMEQDFYKERLISKGIEVMIPSKEDIEIVNKIIYDELCLGDILENSKEEYIRIVNLAIKNGAKGVILGCTEIGMLISQNDFLIPIYDTTLIHGKIASKLSLEK